MLTSDKSLIYFIILIFSYKYLSKSISISVQNNFVFQLNWVFKQAKILLEKEFKKWGFQFMLYKIKLTYLEFEM